MGNINPTYNDRVRYTLKNIQMGDAIIVAPVGWNDDEKEYARNEQYHGIFAKFSNSLKFVEDGADFIQLVLDLYGINEQIELVREERHPKTDVWTLTYSGFLDLLTWNRENNQVSVKFNSGGLEQLLKSRESEKIEIDRLTTIDGKPIPDINPIKVELEGRRIFLKTKFSVKSSENHVVMNNQTNGQTRGSTYPVPFALINQSHENAHAPIPGTRVGDDTWERWGFGETGLMFFAVSDRARSLRVKFTIKFKVVITAFDDINFFGFWFRLAQYEGGSSYTIKQNRILYTTDQFWAIQNQTFSFSFDQVINVAAGDSLGLVFDQNMDGSNGHSAHLDMHIMNIEGDLTIDENSFHEKTETKAMLAHELVDRLVTIATSKEGAFKSDFLGRTDIGYPVDGKGSLTACTHGFWVRGFDKLPIPSEVPKVENLFKPLTTSFKDCVSSLDAVWCAGIGIESIRNKEIVRLEEFSYFYNRNVTVRLPHQIKNVKRSISADKYYSSVEVGYELGGTYEEACGLDEYNAKSTYTTVINRLKNTFQKLSKYRADSYGMEFARRKQKSLNDTEDTTYDSNVFFMDLKRGITSIFKQRKWQDDFAQAPTGVFSPETATNLRLSPFNCLLRHSWLFSGGFKTYMSDYVRYGSSTANSNLKTKLIGGIEYAENGNIINSELKQARFVPEEIEFEHICDFDIMQQINGTSIILGKEIPNFYGLIEFVNERNELERGFLMNLKPNKKGQWKVLKANK